MMFSVIIVCFIESQVRSKLEGGGSQRVRVEVLVILKFGNKLSKGQFYFCMCSQLGGFFEVSFI